MSSKETVTIAIGVVNAQLVNPSSQVKAIVSDALAYKVDGSEHMNRGFGWDGTATFFDFGSCKFPAGFAYLVKKRLNAHGYIVMVKERAAPEPLGDVRPKVDAFPEDPRYNYQFDTIRTLVSLKRMIVQVATGGGKSRIAKLATSRIKRKTLFLTSRKSLMYQMADNFKTMTAEPIGLLGDSIWEPSDFINCATVDTIASRLEERTIEAEVSKRLQRLAEELQKGYEKECKRLGLPYDKVTKKLATKADVAKSEAIYARLEKEQKRDYPVKLLESEIRLKIYEHEKRRSETIEFLKSIEFVIIEEAHEVSANGFYSIMNQCINAHYRMALTATPFMKENEEANMRLMAVTGLIGVKITEKQLIDLGILAKPYFKYVDVPPIKGLFKSTPWQRAYKMGVTHNSWRNVHIVKEAARAAKRGLPVMVLVQHQEHGKILEQMCEKIGLKVKFIFGDHDQSERDFALKALGRGELQVLIGSTIMDVGVDVPAVGMVILAGAGKAEVALRQRIGRGLRAKKTGANVAFIIDFNDSHNNYLRDHAKQRKNIVLSTPGFAENVLPDGYDFNFDKILGVDKDKQ